MTLKEKLVANLTKIFQNDVEFSADILEVIVDNTIEAATIMRNYPDTMSEANIETDLNNLYPLIYKQAEADYAKIGAEGQKAHSENGISRTYESSFEYLSKINAYVRYFV